MEKEGKKHMTEKTKTYFAAIDLGTNSCKALIADDEKKYVYSEAFSVRMGEGMYPDMKFTPEAFSRGLKCFCDLKNILKNYNIAKCRAISTASCRMAKNADEFIKKVYQETGISIEVVDAFEEARLNLKGALQHVCGKTEYVVLYDLGGGSTEITLATNEINPKIVYTLSIPWGARNASEAFNLVEYNQENAQKLREEIALYTSDFVKNSKLDMLREKVCFVATSSTPLRFVSMIKGFDKYDREKADGCWVSCEDIDKQVERILKMTQQQMAEDVYIGQKRSYIFIAACVIFKTIYDGLGADKITASLKSAKDGIVEELIDTYKKKVY